MPVVDRLGLSASGAYCRLRICQDVTACTRAQRRQQIEQAALEEAAAAARMLSRAIVWAFALAVVVYVGAWVLLGRPGGPWGLLWPAAWW